MAERFKILSEEQVIMGKPHVLIARADGFRFYLDPVFLYLLKNYGHSGWHEEMVSFGFSREEIEAMLRMLVGAGLLPQSEEIDCG